MCMIHVHVVYVPGTRRCQFCQKMEEDFEAFAGSADVAAYKFRGDEQRAYVEANMNTASFPTINFLSSDGKLTKYDRSPEMCMACALHVCTCASSCVWHVHCMYAGTRATLAGATAATCSPTSKAPPRRLLL